MEISVSFLEGLLLASITALIGWIWFVHTKLTELQIELARNYHSKEELRKAVEDALFPVWKELDRIARALEKPREDR